MSKGLSNREKKLLHFLACFLIVMGGTYLLILPAANKRLMVQTTLSEAEYQMTNVKQQIASIETVIADIDNAKQQYTQKSKNFIPVMPNESIDDKITTLCIQERLNILGLNISEVITEVLKETAPASGGGTAEPVKIESNLHCKRINVTLTGTMQNIVNLVDTMKEIHYLELASMQMSEKEGNVSCSMDIMIYMLM